jgi:uncharacterized protein YbjT (DUF2867 family)
MKRVLILGGSGFVGRALCEALARLQVKVTVPARRAGNARAVQMLPLVTVLPADVHRADELARLLPGHDAVVNLVAILHGRQADFERAHVALPTTLASACLAAGVKRLVHVSALGADAQGPSMYQRSKAQGEAALQAAAAQGLRLTVLRPSVIFGRDDRFVNTFAALSALPVLPLAGATTRFAPVAVANVAQAIVHCLQDSRTVGQTYELAGPDVFTLQQLVATAAKAVGHAPRIVPLPASLAWAQACLMELLPGEPIISRDNVASLQVDNVASGQRPGLRDLGIEPSSLGAALPGWLAPGDRVARLLDLRRTAGRF